MPLPPPPSSPPAPSREALRAHLLATGIAGTVATPREASLRRYRLFAARDPRALLGLDPLGAWRERDVLALMARRCGVSADPRRTEGVDTVDPDRTLRGLDRFAARLGRAVAERRPVLFGTGHPHRLIGFYAALAQGVSAAGGQVLTPAQGRSVDITTRFGLRTHRIDYVQGVALVRADAGPEAGCEPGAHCHSPLPVRVVLGVAAERGGPLPGLVVGDHGWVCGAGQLGFEAIGPADTDDPAPFVGEAEGRVAVAVPLDDGVRSVCYEPLTRYVLNRACLSP
ncbi:phosphatase [Streptomyces sp. NPDC058372]|uniref:phosphatase n=1 Tax=Streptomyces sp. NPDC058372 TaxID=3346464 RepID=UPI00365C4716